MASTEKEGTSFGTIAAVIGAILVACGIAWLIAQNWHGMPSAVKILVLAAATAGAFVVGIRMRERGYLGIGASLLILGSLLYTLSVFLIAQIFSLGVSVQAFAWLLLLSWAGVLAAAYVLDSSGSLIVGLIEALIWLTLQYVAFAENDFGFGGLAIAYLATGLLLYGLSVLHSAHRFARVYEYFTALYFLIFAYIVSFQLTLPTLWEEAGLRGAMLAFVILAALFSVAVFAFSIGRDRSADRRGVTGVIVLALLLFSVVMISALGDVGGESETGDATYGSCSRKGCSGLDEQSCEARESCFWQGSCLERECYNYGERSLCVSQPGCFWTVSHNEETRESCAGTGCENVITTVARNDTYSSCQRDWQAQTSWDSCANHAGEQACSADSECRWYSYGSYGDYGEMRLFSAFWFIWLYANVVLFGAILAIIAYGTWKRMPALINLGMVFFGLAIVTRYIGFIIDFGGYTSLSVLFIIGGLILIFGGWRLEKWRRKLVEEAR